MLHHVVNEHEWVIGDGFGSAKCAHDSIDSEERDKDWLEKGSQAHICLRQIVLDKRFLNTINYFVNFRLVNSKFSCQS